MEDLQSAYRRYLKAFPLRWNPDHCHPKSFEDFKSLYPFAKAARELYEKKVCQGALNPAESFSMIAADVLLGIVWAEKDARSENNKRRN